MNNIAVNQVTITIDNGETIVVNLDDPDIIHNVSKQLDSNSDLIRKMLYSEGVDNIDAWYFSVNKNCPINISTLGVVSLKFEASGINKYGDKINITLNNNGTLETLNLYDLYHMMLITATHEKRGSYSIYNIGAIEFRTYKNGLCMYFFNQKQLKQKLESSL